MKKKLFAALTISLLSLGLFGTSVAVQNADAATEIAGRSNVWAG